MIKFGPSGNSDRFYEEGFQSTSETPKWLHALSLDIFEYSFGKGVRLRKDTAKGFGAEFDRYGIEISAHAPYYINFATDDPEKSKNNARYITQTFDALLALGGKRCVFHPGSASKIDRKEALKRLLTGVDAFLELKHAVPEYKDLLLCAETMGKKSQLGTLDEIITVCNLAEDVIPCVDFGHLNARDEGILKTYSDYERVINRLLEGIGEAKTRVMHVHFSKIQYSQTGEVRHLTFEDDVYGPNFEPLAEVLRDYKLEPHIICESSGTQADDALYMKKYYESIC